MVIIERDDRRNEDRRLVSEESRSRHVSGGFLRTRSKLNRRNVIVVLGLGLFATKHEILASEITL